MTALDTSAYGHLVYAEQISPARSVVRMLQARTGLTLDLTVNTDFDRDLRLDRVARRGYFHGIKRAIEKGGGRLDKITPRDFEDASTIGNLVGIVWKDVAN